MNPHFSFVIPTLNEEKFLPILLEDLVSQKFTNFEVVICDGKSTDTTQVVAKKFQKKISLKIVISEKQEVSYQRNLGASKAKGNFLIFIDADSRVAKDFLKVLFDTMQKTKYLIYLPHVEPQHGNALEKTMFEVTNILIERSQQIGSPIPIPGVCVFERNYFEYIGGYEGTKTHLSKQYFPEDHEILIRARRNGVSAKYVPKARYFFSMRRIDRDGWWKGFVTKNLQPAISATLTGNVKAKDTLYEMGGETY